jgi:hypothetical protein
MRFWRVGEPKFFPPPFWLLPFQGESYWGRFFTGRCPVLWAFCPVGACWFYRCVLAIQLLACADAIHQKSPMVGCPPYVCQTVLAFSSNLFGSITHRGGRDARVPVRRRFAAIVCLSADGGRIGEPMRFPLQLSACADVTARRSVTHLTFTNTFWRSVPTCSVLLRTEAGGTPAFQSFAAFRRRLRISKHFTPLWGTRASLAPTMSTFFGFG